MSDALPLVVGPVGRGGVAAVIDAVRPHLGPVAFAPAGGGARVVPRWLGGWRAGRRAPVVHLHSSFRWRALARDLALASMLRRGGVPVVLDLHGTSAALRARAPEGVWAALRRFAGSAVLRSVDPGLVVALRDRGIDASTARVAIALGALPAARAPEPGLVLFLGRLVEGKGVRVLLAAASGWAPPIRLVVAGDGPLAAEVARAGAPVEAVGWVDAEGRRAWLARAAVLVLPSASEGAPLAVAEAVASGVPVVASGGAGVAALVGAAGVVLPEPTPEAIRAAVARVLAAPPDTTADRDRVRAACDPASVAHEWREAWALARRRAGRG